MPGPERKPVWRRWVRRALWAKLTLLVLLGLGAAFFLYLNQVGLPGWLKNPLLAELRARGLDLKFQRLRLHWYRGLVADQVILERARTPTGPQLSVQQLQLRLDPQALRQFQVKVSAVLLHQARLTWPLPAQSNQPPAAIDLSDLSAEVHFEPGDRWTLTDLKAQWLGADFQLRGSVTNASFWRRPRSAAATTNAAAARWPDLLRAGMARIQSCHFSSRPLIEVEAHIDAKNTDTLNARLKLQCLHVSAAWGSIEKPEWLIECRPAAGSNHVYQTTLMGRAETATTRWGQGSGLSLTASLVHSGTNFQPQRLEAILLWDRASTDYGGSGPLRLSLNVGPSSTPNMFQSDLHLMVENPVTPPAKAQNVDLTVQMQHRLLGLPAATNMFSHPFRTSPPFQVWQRALEVEWIETKVQGLAVETRWAGLDSANLSVRVTPQDTSPGQVPEASLAGWTNLTPFAIAWTVSGSRLEASNLTLEDLSLKGRWQMPEFRLESLQSRLYGGQVQLQASVNVTNHVITAETGFDFDAQQLKPLLDANGQRWLSQFGWTQPPEVRVRASVRWPDWTNSRPNWQDEVMPSVSLDGRLAARNCAYREVPFSSVNVHFILTNSFWNIPELRAQRPEGPLDLTYECDTSSQDYHWSIRSQIDPQALKPLLTDAQQRALDFFVFSHPPHLKGDLFGRWKALDRTGFRGQVALTNFSFRGESVSEFSTDLAYTNRFLLGSSVRLRCNTEEVSVPFLGFDADQQRLHFTNALAHIDPFVIVRPIGPQTTAAMMPYQFRKPPVVLVNGTLDVEAPVRANLQFDVNGGPFHYWKFNLDEVQARIRWIEDNLVITNLQARAYQGRLTGGLLADFTPEQSSDLQYHLAVTNINLHQLMSDLMTETNKMEGTLAGQVTITHLNSRDWKSWQGHGQANLREGLIWDIPLFGLFSPVLNALFPGLGNNRADRGTATFTIVNSLIHSTDLEIRAPPVRLDYRGTLDFDGQVNARVEAQMFQDTLVIGPLLRLALLPLTKVFEFKVGGTLKEPKAEPLYVLSKVILAPLRPFRTVKDMINASPPKPPAQPAKSDNP